MSSMSSTKNMAFALITLISTATFSSAQNVGGPAGYNAAMPTLSSYAEPQEWAQWTAWLSVAPSSSVISTTAVPLIGQTTLSTSIIAVPTVTSSSSSAPYENPFTIYLTQTDSRGVVTGMPSVITSQPSVVTEQPTAVVDTTLTTSVRSSSSSTTMNPETSVSRTNSGFNQGTSTGPTAPQNTGGAVKDSVTKAGMALVVAALAFSLL